MIVEPAVLVIGDEDDRILPVGSVADGIDHSRDEHLAALNVGGGVIVILIRPTETGIDENYLRQFSGTG